MLKFSTLLERPVLVREATSTWFATALTALDIQAATVSLSKIGAATRAYLFFLVTGLLAFPAHSASAANFEPGFTQKVVATGITSPTAMAIAPDGRIFITEQQGRISVITGSGLLPTPFLNISNKVDSDGERGLLGIAFDPDFRSNRWVYVYYTLKAPNSSYNRVSRFTASRVAVNGGNVAETGSEKVLLDIQPLTTKTNHNGGAIHFSPQGQLLIAVGDNADGSNAQTLSNMKGKLLRINKDGTIPTDNPFYNNPNTSGNDRSIYALGLRNPFNFAVKPGALYINDVGQQNWEEINSWALGGLNFGWPFCEGYNCQSGYQSNPNYKQPIYAYSHNGTDNTQTGCAITGAAFYNPVTVRFPSSYVGDYFFGDFCNGWIRRYDISSRNTSLFAIGLSALVDIQVDQNGFLYLLERGGGGRLTRVNYIGS